jgi:hypothetical protein
MTLIEPIEAPQARQMTHTDYIKAAYPRMLGRQKAKLRHLTHERHQERQDYWERTGSMAVPKLLPIRVEIREIITWMRLRRRALVLMNPAMEPCRHRPPHGILMPDPDDPAKRVLVVGSHCPPLTEAPFDPCGFVASDCQHGLVLPPDADPTLLGPSPRWRGKSFIRGKYVDAGAHCPACYGQPMPADALTPRAGVQCAHSGLA